MTTDFRALCAELVDAIDSSISVQRIFSSPLMQRTRAALAEPEPEQPTKAELKQLFDDHSGYINDEQVMWWGDFHAAGRAILARWGS